MHLSRRHSVQDLRFHISTLAPPPGDEGLGRAAPRLARLAAEAGRSKSGGWQPVLTDGVSPSSWIGHPVLGGGGGFPCSRRKVVDQWLRRTQLTALR
ncbi:hypothetical protein E2562_012868 [Oryza meyeriana var. granulata]|uniref:Uncharacterized protein n=1 Tax=Oryza meyeriana var. granulata TaxID=110450 RepID=A0A6G1CNP2_9ORYZ|nr:hypothetical protein E2562_012868 [Oryza meyeriana var. granulata]